MSDLAATNCGCGCGDGGNNNCLLLILILLEVVATAQAVVVAAMTAQALSGLSCFLAAVAVVVHSLVMETAVVAAAS